MGSITSIYPNPASTNISFDIHLDEAATVKYRVWDYLGNEVSYKTTYSIGSCA